MISAKKFVKIPALQGLRAIAFLCVFFHHSGLGILCTPLGPFGVSVFIVLSGFLMGGKYIANNVELSFNPMFAIKKISQLYPLHIITLVLSIGFCLLSTEVIDCYKLFFRYFYMLL